MNNDNKNITPCAVNVASETGRLRAVLLHRPGVEIERMTPLNAAHALYSDILNKPIVDTEYANFCGVLEKWTDVYYVEDILEELLKDNDIRRHLVETSCKMDKCPELTEKLMSLDAKSLADILVEGYERPEWNGSDDRYLLKPLYNLFFTRDASSTVYNRVLINSMSFEVRERETLIYEAIFKHFFKVDTLNAMQHGTARPAPRAATCRLLRPTSSASARVSAPTRRVSSTWLRLSPRNAIDSIF